jgi:hypothetical protein
MSWHFATAHQPVQILREPKSGQTLTWAFGGVG